MSDVTRILNAIEYGNAKAADELLTLVYDELRRVVFGRALVEHRAAQYVCDRFVACDRSELSTSGKHRPLASEFLVSSRVICRDERRPNLRHRSSEQREEVFSVNFAVEW